MAARKEADSEVGPEDPKQELRILQFNRQPNISVEDVIIAITVILGIIFLACYPWK